MTMIDFTQDQVLAMVQRIIDEGYDQFQTVISLGRWQGGEKLTDTEQALVFQALLVYEHRYVPLELRSGFIYKGRCDS